MGAFGRGNGGGSTVAHATVRAMENSVKTAFGGQGPPNSSLRITSNPNPGLVTSANPGTSPSPGPGTSPGSKPSPSLSAKAVKGSSSSLVVAVGTGSRSRSHTARVELESGEKEGEQKAGRGDKATGGVGEESSSFVSRGVGVGVLLGRCVRGVGEGVAGGVGRVAATAAGAFYEGVGGSVKGVVGGVQGMGRGLSGVMRREGRAAATLSSAGTDDKPLALVGCMCHSTENLYNYHETSMARASDDFYPKGGRHPLLPLYPLYPRHPLYCLYTLSTPSIAYTPINPFTPSTPLLPQRRAGTDGASPLPLLYPLHPLHPRLSRLPFTPSPPLSPLHPFYPYPKDVPAQTVHLVSCAYNSVMLGEIATTDWDMFHSKHPFAGN